MKIIPNPQFQGYNTSPRTQKIQFIVVHYVGDVGSAANNVAYFNGGNRSASADFFVGHDGVICQYNPTIEHRYSWHCGGGRQTAYGGAFFNQCTNGNSIGIEMCCRKNGNVWYFEDATVKACVELVQYLMNRYGVPLGHVIRHYDVTGKFCPGIPGWIPPTGSEAKWTAFKTAVAGYGAPDLSDGSDEGGYTVTLNTLKKGSSGPQVLLLQKLLRMAGKKGADGKALTLDGDYGDNTVAALKKYQKAVKITQDGVCGPATWKKIIGF